MTASAKSLAADSRTPTTKAERDAISAVSRAALAQSAAASAAALASPVACPPPPPPPPPPPRQPTPPHSSILIVMSPLTTRTGRGDRHRTLTHRPLRICRHDRRCRARRRRQRAQHCSSRAVQRNAFVRDRREAGRGGEAAVGLLARMQRSQCNAPARPHATPPCSTRTHAAAARGRVTTLLRPPAPASYVHACSCPSRRHEVARVSLPARHNPPPSLEEGFGAHAQANERMHGPPEVATAKKGPRREEPFSSTRGSSPRRLQADQYVEGTGRSVVGRVRVLTYTLNPRRPNQGVKTDSGPHRSDSTPHPFA